MRRFVRRLVDLNALIFLPCLMCCLLVPTLALAQPFEWDWGWDWGWSNLDLWQRQREAQSAADEAARQAYREKRADELEKERQQQLKDHEVYFNDVMEASKAAAGRPRGLYYRKPGFASTDAPVNPQKVTVNNFPFLYDRGIFWLSAGTQFVVVTAPFGAVVDKLPEGSSSILGPSGSTFYYYFGTFFTSTKEGKYEVVNPPAGLLVFYLPDGYQQFEVKGQAMYKFGEIYFKPFVGGGASVFATATL